MRVFGVGKRHFRCLKILFVLVLFSRRKSQRETHTSPSCRSLLAPALCCDYFLCAFRLHISAGAIATYTRKKQSKVVQVYLPHKAGNGTVDPYIRFPKINSNGSEVDKSITEEHKYQLHCSCSNISQDHEEGNCEIPQLNKVCWHDNQASRDPKEGQPKPTLMLQTICNLYDREHIQGGES